MAAEWSGLAAEVLVTLDRSRSVPLRAQLEDQFRRAIRSGRLGSGERVPSSRALATALGLSRGLVQECYAQLLAEGYLVTRGGSATRAARAAFRAEPARQPPSPTPGRLAADFASGVPDLASAPRQGWAWAVCEACRIAPNTEFGYGDPAGNPRLREVPRRLGTPPAPRTPPLPRAAGFPRIAAGFPRIDVGFPQMLRKTDADHENRRPLGGQVNTSERT